MDFLQFPRRQRRRIEKYLVVRFAIVLMAIGLAALHQLGVTPEQRPPTFRLLYSLLGLHLFVGTIALVLVNRWGERGWFAPVQVAIDFSFAAILVATTGGVSSVFCPLIFAILFSACTVLEFRGAIVFATLASVFLTIITLKGTSDFLPQIGARPVNSTHQMNLDIAYLTGLAIGLHVVAILGSQISTGLISVQRLQSEILERMGDGLIAVDKNNRVIQINREARRILSLNGNALFIGESVDRVLSRQELEPIRAAMRRSGYIQTQVEVADGVTRHLEVKVATVHGSRDQLRFRVSLLTDLSLKREVEAAERRIERLQQVYEMSLGIAHEIRNPLASIRGCVQELGRLQPNSSSSARLVDIVCRESDRLDRIIEEFMSSTRKSPRPTEEVDVLEVVSETVILLKNHPKYSGRRLDLVSDDGFSLVLGNRERLQQAVLNLGLNALASTPTGDGVVKVTVGLCSFLDQSVGDGIRGVEIRVEDNGIGIPSANLERIFTPFFTCRDSGTGLGLSIVNRIIHDHGGIINVESEEGKGTTFAIRLPAVQQQRRAVGRIMESERQDDRTNEANKDIIAV